MIVNVQYTKVGYEGLHNYSEDLHNSALNGRIAADYDSLSKDPGMESRSQEFRDASTAHKLASYASGFSSSNLTTTMKPTGSLPISSAHSNSRQRVLEN